LVREQERKRKARKPAQARSPRRKKAQDKPEDPMQDGIDLALETAEALNVERGDQDKLWGSMVKQALKRRRPGFNESYYGFESFSKLLEEAQARGQLELELDARSRSYIIRQVLR
ncbi:MAG: OST-HTH/LOTUS domain-containing protein, partial [Rhodospirillaceae bacterium]|nr:OST-HTH/LOTUS domain-containing protein [Rhodospirillaceae bacterium]